MDRVSVSGFQNARFRNITQNPVEIISNLSDVEMLRQQKKHDEDYINNFITSLQTKKIIKNNTVKISQAKSILLGIMKEKKAVEKDLLSLSVSDENFQSRIEILQKKIQEIDDRILNFNLKLKDPLKIALHKRLKKRSAMKARRNKIKAIKEFRQKEIQEKHLMIEKILNERREEVESIKYEASLKRQADSVFHEVRRKKHEAKKMLNLLVALGKLRELRSKEEEKHGGYCSKQLAETFNKVITRFKNLWEKQLEVYKLEEKGLKIMLEENTLPQKKSSEVEANIFQWEKALFGDAVNNEINPSINIQNLIQIRKDWDQFLTSESAPMASSIPIGWVLPSETEDEHWKAFLQTKKNPLI